MKDWLRQKMDSLALSFQEGAGEGAMFEAQYLIYLECLVAATKGPDDAPIVWEGWVEVCTEAATEGQGPLCLSSRVTDRGELVAALQRFQRRFEAPKKGPRPRKTRPHIHSEPEGDLFAFLSEDDTR